MVNSGTPCDIHGHDLPPNTPPPRQPPRRADDYYPFEDRVQFELADFFFRKEEMSATKLDELMQLWAARSHPGDEPPFADHADMYNAIDAIPVGEVRWKCFSVSYGGPRPESGEVPPWMDAEYLVWFRCPREIARNQLRNPEFASGMDWAPKRVFDSRGRREYRDFMSGNWAWRQAVSRICVCINISHV